MPELYDTEVGYHTWLSKLEAGQQSVDRSLKLVVRETYLFTQCIPLGPMYAKKWRHYVTCTTIVYKSTSTDAIVLCKLLMVLINEILLGKW